MKHIHFCVLGSAILLAMGQGTEATGQTKWDTSEISTPVPPVVTRSIDFGRTDPSQPLHLAISLQPADADGLEAYADSVSDPKSPNYRSFLTPTEVGNRFGATTAQVKAVTDYLQSYGFRVDLVAKNHLSVLVTGSAGQAEQAFHTSIRNLNSFFSGEAGNSQYYSYVSPLKASRTVAPLILDVMGLESFTRPQMRGLTAAQTRSLYNSSPIYAAGKQGQGRTVGISNWDGFRLSNVPLYYSQNGLPTPSGGVGSNVHVVAISGGAGAGTPQGEGDLDIQMVLGMAPLCEFYIYDGGSSNLIGVLTQEVNDNKCDIISESWGWGLPASTALAAHNLHLSMTAQGITYMAASGDSGTTIEPYSYPNYDPEVLMVGGTVATVNASSTRATEVGWSGSGGGWSLNTSAFNTLPSWQKGTGVPTGNNHRLCPDVALQASGSGGAYPFYLNGSLTNGYVGTSFACPVFAGQLAIAEQSIIANGGLIANGAGKQRFGRIQDVFYAQNGRSDVWYDVTSGSNGKLPSGTTSNCTAGWDFVTGWGAINFNAFVATQGPQIPIPAAPTGLTATPASTQVTLNWNASANATSYNVKRAATATGAYTVIASPTTNSYVNTGLTNGTTYYYVVSAVSAGGQSANSAQVSSKPQIPAPVAPTNLVATPSNGQVSLTWTASAGATSYNVKRAATATGAYTTLASATTTSYVNTGLTNGTTYYYVVTAVNAGGESPASGQVSAKPQLLPPAAPSTLTATAGSSQVSLSWAASTGATSYNVKRATVSGGPYTTVTASTTATYVNTGLTNGTKYYYVVTAVNAGGESPASVEASATPVLGASQQLLLNPGFESGAASWTATPTTIINTTATEAAHAGSYKAWLCGTGKSRQDTLYQQVAVPASITSATLTFYLHIDTAETGTAATDTLILQVKNGSNAVLKTLATYSNLNASGGYSQISFDLSAYKGQTIRIFFTGSENATKQTSYVLDDLALTVQ